MVLVLPEELEPFYDDRTGEFSEDSPEVREWLAMAVQTICRAAPGLASEPKRRRRRAPG